MLIINLSYNPSDYFGFKKTENTDVLDITNVLDNSVVKRIISIGTLQSNFDTLKQATLEMIEAIGKVSLLPLNNKELIRDIQVNGLHLFWQTALSEKFPTRSFLINLFYLKNILANTINVTAYKKIGIVLPSKQVVCYKTAIQSFFKNSYQITDIKFNVEEDYMGVMTYGAFFKKVKNNVAESSYFNKKLKALTLRPNSNTIRNFSVVTISAPSWNENEGRDRLLGFIHDGERKNTSSYLPYFKDLFADFKWNDAWYANYVNFLPSKVQIVKHQLYKWKAYKSIRSLGKVDYTSTDFIDAHVLQHELSSALFRNYNHINFQWMKNFFSSITSPTNVFYYGEFYIQAGRVISQAVNRAENNNVTSYGYQHGNIYEGHAVYHLTPAELNCNKPFNGLPKPKHFIVWGQYFKDLLNRRRAFKDGEVVIAGNLNYLNIYTKYISKTHISQSPTFLWCTTMEFLANKEFEIIKPFLNSLSSYKLIIRCHPGHQIQNQVLNLFDQQSIKNVSICEYNDLFHALFKSDYVIASTASTIFMDALVLNKPVFQIQTDAFFMELIPSPNTFVIHSSEELEKFYLANISMGIKKEFVQHQTLLHLDESAWTQILKPVT